MYVYRAVIERRNAQRWVLRGVLARFFGGSAEDLVMRLIEDERITPEQLDELRRAAPETLDKASIGKPAQAKGKVRGARS